MVGPYTANKDRTISYRGNKIFGKIDDIYSMKVPLIEFEGRVSQFANDDMWGHIARINHQINLSANEFFCSVRALFTLLPLTTRMISSPGAVYGRKAINYTTDTCPITLKWFDLEENAFLSESSQIYLELAMIQSNVDKVYSIYNSFRKEKTDATHLSEFHHIEFEGKVLQAENEYIALSLLKKILLDLVRNERESLAFFLEEEKINSLLSLAEKIFDIPRITFRKALGLLYEDTGDEKYKEFTLKNFGAWEEIRITEILGNMVLIKEFPLLEVSFYHSVFEGKSSEVANNADLIWPGYREILGSGQRVGSEDELGEKARIFNLPRKDYEPYLQTRRLSKYKTTSGFGLGWERLLQGILEMPFIWSAMQFPRVDGGLKP